jgi:hypothetical protein
VVAGLQDGAAQLLTQSCDELLLNMPLGIAGEQE